MKTLLILNQQPYDGTDFTWNALRLAHKLHEDGAEVRLFLMSDAVDLARESVKPPPGVDDMVAMVRDLYALGAQVKVCGTCQARCGIKKGEPYFAEELTAAMADLSVWVRDSDRVLTF